jgi:hypothetical protein
MTTKTRLTSLVLAAAFATTTMLAGSALAKPAHGFGVTISDSGNGRGNTVVAPSRGGSVTSRRQHGLISPSAVAER